MNVLQGVRRIESSLMPIPLFGLFAALICCAAAPLPARSPVAAQDEGAPPQQEADAQDPATEEEAGQDEPPAPSADMAARHERFREMLDGVKLVGRFTVTGAPAERMPAPEEYTITSVRKLPGRDLWLFNARIKYGRFDVTVPLPLPVQWAGDTPMIAVDDFSIPGLGSEFGARVIFHDGKYAGTWSHGEVTGHLFGTIEPLEKD